MKKGHNHLFLMMLLFLAGLLVGTQYRSIWRMLPRAKARARYMPEVETCTPCMQPREEVASASAGEPYNIFIQRVGRVPRSRYEYKKWLKYNYTTDWEYWYDRYREYREWRDGYSVGSGPFTHPRHQ